MKLTLNKFKKMIESELKISKSQLNIKENIKSISVEEMLDSWGFIAQLTDSDFSEFELDFTTKYPGEKILLDFSQLNMANINFSNAELIEHDISNAELSKANFQHAKINGCYIINSKLNQANFQHANLLNVNFLSSTLNRCNFQHANLQNTNFSDCIILGADFTGAKIDHSTNLDGAILIGSKLNPLILTKRQRESIILDYKDLKEKSHLIPQNKMDFLTTELSHFNRKTSSDSKSFIKRHNTEEKKKVASFTERILDQKDNRGMLTIT